VIKNEYEVLKHLKDEGSANPNLIQLYHVFLKESSNDIIVQGI